MSGRSFFREHVAAICSASEHKVAERESVNHVAATFFGILNFDLEQLLYNFQFLVVDFENVAAFQGIGYDFLAVVVLSQVDVENLQRVGRHGIKKAFNRVSAD